MQVSFTSDPNPVSLSTAILEFPTLYRLLAARQPLQHSHSGYIAFFRGALLVM